MPLRRYVSNILVILGLFVLGVPVFREFSLVHAGRTKCHHNISWVRTHHSNTCIGVVVVVLFSAARTVVEMSSITPTAHPFELDENFHYTDGRYSVKEEARTHTGLDSRTNAPHTQYTALRAKPQRMLPHRHLCQYASRQKHIYSTKWCGARAIPFARSASTALLVHRARKRKKTRLHSLATNQIDVKCTGWWKQVYGIFVRGFSCPIERTHGHTSRDLVARVFFVG